MTETGEVDGRLLWRILGIMAAVVIPTVLTFLFWRTTPTVGGWGTGTGLAGAPSSSVAYSQNGRIPAGQTDVPPAALFQQSCARCHGADLAGTDKVPALRQSHWPYAQNRDFLIKVIHQGRGLTMPGFEGKLSNQQIESLADYLQKENGVR